MKISGMLIISLLIVACSQQEKQADTSSSTATPVATPVTSDLPTLLFTTTTGKEINAKKLAGKTIIVLFQPDCDHCQREAVHIQENLTSFRLYSMYFISADMPEKIKSFADEYKLAGVENIMFGRAEGDQIFKAFGPVAAPSVYIYDENGKLKKKFNGETEIDQILSSL